jgi:hypothetical protein
MAKTDEASLVCANLAAHRHGYTRLLVGVQDRMLLGRAYTPFHRGSSREPLLVEQDTIGAAEDKDWEQIE